MKKVQRMIGAGALATMALGGIGVNMAASASAASVPAKLQIIRWCESRNNYKIVNSIGAAGAYQITRATWHDFGDRRWPTADKAPNSVQDATAMKIYAKRGESPWYASKTCWEPRYEQYFKYTLIMGVPAANRIYGIH